jgi:uncharacterized membrane-anchored protein YitT (DUF2179 family)
MLVAVVKRSPNELDLFATKDTTLKIVIIIKKKKNAQVNVIKNVNEKAIKLLPLSQK